MKNIKILILVAMFMQLMTSCNNEIIPGTEGLTLEKIGEALPIIYQLDNIPIVENSQEINNLLKNPYDSDDEKIKGILFEISIAIRELIKDKEFNQLIIELAYNSPNQTANLLMLSNLAPKYFDAINNELSKKGLSLMVLADNLTHKPTHPIPDYPMTEKVEKYFPAIFIPNLSILDKNKQPIISPNLQVDSRVDDSIEDNIIAWYYTENGDLKEMLLSEETSLKTSNPLFLLDNASIKVKKNEMEILPPDYPRTKSALTATTFQSYDYGIQNGYSYEDWLSGKSEFCVVAYRIDPSGNVHWIYNSSGWKEIAQISRDDIGTELYLWSHHADNWLPYNTNYVFWNTFERDWNYSPKSLGSATANGVTIYLSGNRRYDEEWYTWIPETLQLHNTPFQWVVENDYLDFNNWKSWFSIWKVDI